MKRKVSYYLNLLIYNLAALLYGMALSYMATRLVEIRMDPFDHVLFYLIALVFILVLFTYPFLSLALLALVGGYFGIRILDDGAYLVQLMSTPLAQEIESTVRAGMLYFGAQNLLIPEVIYYIRALQILSVFLGVLLLWRLPLPHFALALLVLPLFFMPGFLLDRVWLIWLAVGMLALLMSFTLRYDVRGRLRQVRQLPPVLPIVLVLVLTLGLGSVLPSEWFFSSSLSRFVNDLDDRFDADNGFDNRGLFVNYGTYYSDNAPMNGLVSRTGTPYLRVIGDPRAFYLRGTVYEEFRNLAWQASDPKPSEVFRNQTKTINQHTSFGKAPSDSRTSLLYFKSDLTILPLQLPSKVVYIGNFPDMIRTAQVSFSNGQELELAKRYAQADIASIEVREVGGSPFNFNFQGQVYKSSSQSADPYQVSGWFVPVNSQARDAALLDDGFAPRPYALEIRNKLDRKQGELDSRILIDAYGEEQWNTYLPGKQEYRDLVEQYDPDLAALLYRRTEDQRAKMQVVLDVTNYLKAHYTYNLEVDDIPRKQDFMAWFLEGKEGYCVHFATALTFLLQDVDINARYVEGFLVKQASGSDRLVTTDNAHAWTEVDLQGVGWYPFDATPPESLTTLAEGHPTQPAESGGAPVGDQEIIPEIRRPDPPTSGETAPVPETIPNESAQAMDIPWGLLLVAGFGAFIAWRYTLHTLRHNSVWLRRKFSGREDELVRRVFKDILYLHRISGYSLPVVWSHLARFREVLARYAALDESQGALAMRAIEEVYYAERMPSPEQLEGLLKYYEQLEKRIQQKLPTYEWLMRRFLYSPRFPL